jgi:hypothetical protein
VYGKVFRSIYAGSLHGHWEAIVTFQQLIVLCDPDGVVDMTPTALAAVTSIPLDILEAGLLLLESNDPHSRTPGDEGKRIVRLSALRPWGWRIVNHALYRQASSAADRRLAAAERQRRHRERLSSQPDAPASRAVTPGHVSSRPSRQTDTDSRTPEAEDQNRLLAPFSVRPLTVGSPPEGGSPPALPLAGGRSEAVLSEPYLAELRSCYPGVNLEAELRAMRGWLVSNQANRKTPGGMTRFVAAWLAKSQNTAPRSGAQAPVARAGDRSYLEHDREARNG